MSRPGFERRHVVLIATLTWPGLALLGAGLAPAAVGSRVDAVAAGIALGIGAPIAAITSIVIGVGDYFGSRVDHRGRRPVKPSGRRSGSVSSARCGSLRSWSSPW